MNEMTDAEARAEFLRRHDICDHPYSRTPDPCCGRDASRHLGFGSIPWTLPLIDDIRALIAETSTGGE